MANIQKQTNNGQQNISQKTTVCLTRDPLEDERIIDKEGHLFVSRKSSLMDNSETQAVLGTRQLLSCIDY
jgi:hypothetical protein